MSDLFGIETSVRVGVIIIALLFLIWLELHLKLARLEEKINSLGEVSSVEVSGK